MGTNMGEQNSQYGEGYNMGGNIYNTNDHQRMIGYNGGYQMGYQRRRPEIPPLGTGSQYGTVQGGYQGHPLRPLGMDGISSHPMKFKKGHKATHGEMPQRQGQGERGRARTRGGPSRKRRHRKRWLKGQRVARSLGAREQARVHRSRQRDPEGVTPKRHKGSRQGGLW